MTELTWTTTRNEITRLFNGQTPRPQDEQTIIDHWENHPATVTQAARELSAQVHNGSITWGWSTLKARLERGAQPARQATTNPTHERQTALTQAERYIANAGHYLEHEHDILDELLNPLGPLHHWCQITFTETPDGKHTNTYTLTGDTTLAHHILQHWKQNRPRAIQADTEAAERDAKWLASPPALRWSHEPDIEPPPPS